MTKQAADNAQQDSSGVKTPQRAPKATTSAVLSPPKTGTPKKPSPATQSPLTYDELQASIAQLGLYDAFKSVISKATDKNLSALGDVVLKAVKDQPDSARHGLANALLRDSKRDMGVAETDKTRRSSKIVQQVLFEFWMDMLHGHTSTKAQAKSSATSDFTRIRAIDMMSKRVFENLHNPSQLNDFIKAVSIKTQTFSIWNKLLRVKCKATNAKKATTFNILKDHRKMTVEMVTSHNFESSDDLNDGSLSLYQALSSSISTRLRTMMVTHEEEIGLSGPKFLFFILRTLTDEMSTLAREVNDEVRDLPNTLKKNSYDIPTIAPRLKMKLVALRNAGGNLTSMYDHIMSAFTDLDINEFKNKLSTFSFKMESLQTTDSNDLRGTRAILLLKEAPQMVKEVKAMKKWKWADPTKGGSKQSTTSNSKDDLTGFNALQEQMASMTSEIKALYSKSSVHNKGGKNPFKKPGIYKIGDHQWSLTDKNLLDSKEQFENFLNGVYGKSKVSYNGAWWHWCAKCNKNKGRMGSHPTDRHMVGGTENTNKSLKRKANASSTATPDCLVFAQNARLRRAEPEPIKLLSDTEGGTDVDAYDASDLED